MFFGITAIDVKLSVANAGSITVDDNVVLVYLRVFAHNTHIELQSVELHVPEQHKNTTQWLICLDIKF